MDETQQAMRESIGLAAQILIIRVWQAIKSGQPLN
jgi:hypothetical protein